MYIKIVFQYFERERKVFQNIRPLEYNFPLVWFLSMLERYGILYSIFRSLFAVRITSVNEWNVKVKHAEYIFLRNINRLDHRRRGRLPFTSMLRKYCTSLTWQCERIKSSLIALESSCCNS